MKHADIIGKMTLEEKATLMTGRDFWSTKDYAEYGIPAMYLSDGPHGVRKQAAASDHLGLNVSVPATCFPTASAMASSWNTELGEKMGEMLGEEAAAQNVNVLLGPGMNMKRNPLCGRNFEYFSEDPYLAGKMSAAYVRGIQKNGISACIKHFAANNQEKRRMVSDSVMDERTMREIYLTGFEIAVEEGKPKSIMSSYNKLNGTFTNENMHLMKDILRGEWGFDGVVVTDWAACNDRVDGVKAGNELEMPSCKYGIGDIVKAVQEGRLDEKEVDECVDRLLDLILQTDEAVKAAPKEFDKEAHHAVAEKCAEECVILLKNENKALPLGEEEKVCVIGDFAEKPRYQGAGSSIVNPTKLDSFLDCLKECKLNYIGFEKGFDRYGKKKKDLAKKAVELAEKADTVLFFAGLDEVTEAEGLDRSSMKLPEAQMTLLESLLGLGKKVVVVLSCGSSVELTTVAKADALVHAYLTGQAGAHAVLNVLTGAVNPSGKLSESYPIAYEDCSSAKWFPGEKMTVEYREGPYIGYRYYVTAGVPVQYPFGYGLSYTEFAYSGLEVSEEGVSFTLKNTGDRDGAEVAQLYVSLPGAKVFRPERELKGFAKVFLKAGEETKVSIPFDGRTFRYFNVKTNKWEVEGGEYTVSVGASCMDIRLTGVISKEGTTDVEPYDPAALPSYYSGRANDVGAEEFTTLLGHEIPSPDYVFYKKNRMVIHENCTVADLRYSRRWAGRLFAWAIRFAQGFLKAIGNRSMANTLEMGVTHQPVRGLAKFGGMSRRQMEALMLIFNGHLCKGAVQFLTKSKEEKAAKKAAKKAEKEKKKEKDAA